MKEITCTDGTKMMRISRWIKLRHNYNPSKRNSLWDYVRDGCGYPPHSKDFNPDRDGLYLDYFIFRGKTFSLEQFYVLGGFWTSEQPYFYDAEDGKLGVIGTVYMDGPIFGPALYAEWDEYCEYVRLYEEVS